MPEAVSSSAHTYAESEEIAWIRLAQRGDTRAFGRVMERYIGLLHRVVRQRGIIPPDDLVQEVILEAWQKVRNFKPEKGSFQAWLATIARHRAIDQRRAAGRRPPFTSPEEVDTHVSTEKGTYERVEERSVLDKLSFLSSHSRQAILLTYFYGHTMNEAAEHAGVPVETMKARVRRAIAQLRETMKEDGVST